MTLPISWNTSTFFLLLSSSSKTYGFINTYPRHLYLPNTNDSLIKRFSSQIDETTTTTSSTKTKPNLEILSELSNCESGLTAQTILETAFPPHDDDGNNSNHLFNSLSIPSGATLKSISDADLAIQTGMRNKKFKITELIEVNGDRDADRASLFLLCTMIASVTSAVSVNQNFPGPEILRFIIVWLLCFAPLGFVGAGLAIPEQLQRVLVRIQRSLFFSYRERMIQHEAGHFLIGYLLGIPIQNYRVDAMKNAVEFYPLADKEVGRSRARQLGFDMRRGSSVQEEVKAVEVEDKPFFSEEGKGDELLQRSVFRQSDKKKQREAMLKLPSRDDPSKSWPYRGFGEKTLDKLTVVSLAGVCAEIISFGNAEGGYADLEQLRKFFASSTTEMSDKDMENRVRYAIGYGVSQLRRHLGVLDDLTDVMRRGGSVEECILAIESCENVSGPSSILGDSYEKERREKLLSQLNFFEKVFLRGEKNTDVEDDLIEGKGGGERKKRWADVVGDDPLYIAGGLALAFYIWASSGGLTLH